MLSRLRSFGSSRSRPIAFKTSSNEPRRLLLGAAASGRLAGADAVAAAERHPCRARPFPLHVDRRELAAEIEAREGRTLGWDLLYSLVAVPAVLVVAAALENYRGEETALLTAVGAGLFGALFFFIQLRQDRRRARADFSPAAFDAARAEAEAAEDPDSEPPGATAPLVVYAGRSPFAQFGWALGEWNLVVDAARPKQEAGAPTLIRRPDRDALERRIVDSLARAGHVEAGPDPIYVAQGAALPPAMKPESGRRPPETVALSDGWDAEGAPGAPVRRYLWMRRAGWSNEIALSYFLRVGRSGDDLTLDIAAAVMPPVAAEHRWIDLQRPVTFRSVVSDILQSLVCGPFMLAIGPFRVMNFLGQIFSNEEKRMIREAEDDAAFDYGAAESPRAAYASLEALSYFQDADRHAAEAAFTGRILRAFIDYLDECGVDTSELREQRSMVLNQGVIVNNGDFRAQNVAAGTGASVRAVGATSQAGGSARRREAA